MRIGSMTKFGPFVEIKFCRFFHYMKTDQEFDYMNQSKDYLE